MSKRVVVLLGLLAYGICLSALVLNSNFAVFPSPQAAPMDSVEAATSSALSPNAINPDSWQSRNLPDTWIDNPGTDQRTWYRAEFRVSDPGLNPWATYLPALAHSAAVYINGTWIGQGGSFSHPVSRHHNNPLLFRFSPDLLQTGSNEIVVRVDAATDRQGRLGEIYVAPAEQLTQAYRIKKIVRIDLVMWITVAMYAMSLMILAFWLARRQDHIYSLFSLELFIWATHNLNLLVTDIPVSARLWEALNIATLGWLVVVLIIFIFRFLDTVNQAVERALVIFGIAITGLFFLPDTETVLTIGYGVVDTFLLIIGSYSIVFLSREYWNRQNQDVFLMLLVGMPILAFGLHDILVVNQLSDVEEGLIIQYSVVPALMLFSWFLIRRFVQSIERAESLAAGLEIRVAERTRELEAQHQSIQALQKDSVLAEERERIMRDMHDGMGGQLLSISTFLHDYSGGVFDKIKEKVERSLTDLRCVIDSLDPLYNDLSVLLGAMRGRIQDQADGASIELEWAVTDLPEFTEIAPVRSLHTMRIVQEAVTNAARHSGCDRIRIATGIAEDESGSVYVDILDDGHGFETSDSAASSSRGIANMHNRAREIQAELKLTSSPAGTLVRLTVPVR